MAQLCESCGKKNDFLHGDEFDLGNEKILCHKCAAPIHDAISDIYYVETEEDFEQLEEKILATCKGCFDDNITQAIANKITRIYQQKFPKEVASPSTTPVKERNTKLYSNIGNKIKILAKVTAIIGTILSIIFGIDAIADKEWKFGIYVILLGSILSWIASFVLYGFGQLIENSDKLVELTQKQEKENEK